MDHLSPNHQGKTVNQEDNPSFIKVQISPSNRAECRGCKTKIDKDEVRIGMCFDDGITRSYPWHHLKCFYLTKAYLDVRFEPADIKGFSTLDQNNKLVVEDRILKLMSGQIKKAKFSSGKKDKNKDISSVDDQTLYKQGGYTELQRKQFKQYLEEYGRMTVKQLQAMLEYNQQPKNGNKQEVLEKVCDGWLLGSIPKCPHCQKGSLTFNRYDGSYKCKGFFNEDQGQYHRCGKKFKRDQIKRDQFA